MPHDLDSASITTLGKEDNGSKETTPRPHHEVQPPRSGLSIVQLIVGASAAVGLLAFFWRSLDSPRSNQDVITVPQPAPSLDICPGYSASSVEITAIGLTARLHLSGDSCNIYGPDLQALLLTVAYETGGFPFILQCSTKLMVNSI
jgi:hypothetical protein